MVAAEAVQKDERPAGADAFVVEREFAYFESARGDSIFHVAALDARKSSIKSLILLPALAPQTMTARIMAAGEPLRPRSRRDQVKRPWITRNASVRSA